MDRFIILDVDGVLNTYEYIWSLKDDEITYKTQEDWHVSRLKAECIEVLNKILAETGALVVLSASMRKLFDVWTLQNIFERAGFTGQIISKTDGSLTGYRGEEIEYWMRLCGVRREQCVILEDEVVHMDNVLDRTVSINNKTGLQESHLQQVKELFNLL